MDKTNNRNLNSYLGLSEVHKERSMADYNLVEYDMNADPAHANDCHPSASKADSYPPP